MPDQVPAWLAEVLHVVRGFADREHEGPVSTLVPWHAQNALAHVPGEVLDAAAVPRWAGPRR